MPVIILGGIFGGIFTATESAAVAVLYGLAGGALYYRELGWRDLPRLLTESGRDDGDREPPSRAGRPLRVGADRAPHPATLASMILALSPEPLGFLLLVNILFLIGGCFLNATALLVILVPILCRWRSGSGSTCVHFGIILPGEPRHRLRDAAGGDVPLRRVLDLPRAPLARAAAALAVPGRDGPDAGRGDLLAVAHPGRSRGCSSATERRHAQHRGPLTISMFLGSFAWSFAFISLPFYIQSISTYDSAATLRWSAGSSASPRSSPSVTSPAVGPGGERATRAGSTSWCRLFQGLAFMGMAIAHTLRQLFVARSIPGRDGRASTPRVHHRGPADRSRGRCAAKVAAVQLADDDGDQVLGPLGGRRAAARVGGSGPVVRAVGGIILLGSGAFVHWGVRLPAHLERTRRELPGRGAGISCSPCCSSWRSRTSSSS
jgi:hypothetical protein